MIFNSDYTLSLNIFSSDLFNEIYSFEKKKKIPCVFILLFYCFVFCVYQTDYKMICSVV